MGVSTEPGGAYSSGAHIERPNGFTVTEYRFGIVVL